MGESRILARRLLPAQRRGGGVGQEHRAERPICEAQRDGRRVLDGMPARLVRCKRLHRGDLAAERAESRDLVDHVDQDRAAARLAAPRPLVEISVRLVEQRASHDGDDRPQRPARDDFARLGDDRAVQPVMPNEDRNAGCLGGGANPLAAGDIMRNRLLDQARDAGRDERQALLGVHVVRRCDDRSVELPIGKQRIEVMVMRDAQVLREVAGTSGRIDDRGK
jgi:hypothetical protein